MSGFPALEFSRVIDPPWTHFEPVRLGRIPRGEPGAVCYVLVEDKSGPQIRIDLYGSSDELYIFREVCRWSRFVAIGWGHHLYLVEVETRQVSNFDLSCYFCQMHCGEETLIVASAERLWCLASNGSLIWTSDELGIDGVRIDRVEIDVVYGEGEWDPPGGWRPFRVNTATGQVL